MSFRVKVKTELGEFQYFAIAQEACAVFDAAYDFFGACGVSVNPVRGGK
ncbi:MAG: hypothetical protein WA071_15050 [Undibacterium umbellatum]